jgi:WD40 repeat protein
MTPDAAMIVAGGGNRVQAWYNSGSGLGQNVTETVSDIKISPLKDQIIVATNRALRGYNLSYVPNWDDDTISPGVIALSGDGSGIVIPNGNHIRMYHGGGTLLWDRSFPGGNIISLAYSRDGSTIVAGRDDSTVMVIDRNGQILWQGKAGYWVTGVSVSDDGSTIATGSLDKQVRLFNRQGTLLGSYQTNGPVTSRSVAMSGDGSLIVAADTSTVYGFSRPPDPVAVASPAPEITGTPAGTIQDRTTIVTTISPAGIVPSGNTPVPPTGTTPSSPFPWVLTLVPLALIPLSRKK